MKSKTFLGTAIIALLLGPAIAFSQQHTVSYNLSQLLSAHQQVDPTQLTYRVQLQV